MPNVKHTKRSPAAGERRSRQRYFTAMSAKRPLLSPEYASGDDDAFAPRRLTVGGDNTVPAPTDAAWAVAFKLNVAITLLSVGVVAFVFCVVVSSLLF